MRSRIITKIHAAVVFPFWYLMYHGDENPIRCWREYWQVVSHIGGGWYECEQLSEDADRPEVCWDCGEEFRRGSLEDGLCSGCIKNG